MDFVWNPWAALHLVVGSLSIAAAAFVFLLRPTARQNRFLGLALFIEGAIFVTVGATWSAAEPSGAYAARVVNQALVWGWPLSYLLFLGTLDSPLARPFAQRTARWAIGAVWLGGSFSVLLRPEWYILRIERVPLPAFDAVWGPANDILVILFQAVFLYGLAVALTAWRQAPAGSMQRSRGVAYLMAFGVRDVLLIASPIALAAGWGPMDGLVAIITLQVAAMLLFVTLLMYGILKTHLFDIDLKIKWTIKRSTLVAIFIALFFVVSESAATFFGERWGTYAGILAAGLLLFALAPLQRLADHVTDAALPRIQDTPAYLLARKLEVYRAAVHDAAHDAVITERERRILAGLRRSLGIPERDAAMVEADVLAALGGDEGSRI